VRGPPRHDNSPHPPFHHPFKHHCSWALFNVTNPHIVTLGIESITKYRKDLQSKHISISLYLETAIKEAGMRGCRALTQDEVRVVALSFGGGYAARDRALFIVGVKTGFRISELLSLRVRDVYYAGRVTDQVTVRRQNMKRKTEGRTIRLHQQAQEALATWLKEMEARGWLGQDEPLFRSKKRGAISRIHALRVLREAFEVNELSGQLGTHAMRKTFAKRVFDLSKGDLIACQRALGHRNINSTVSYLSFNQDELDEIILKA
jgi:integrase